MSVYNDVTLNVFYILSVRMTTLVCVREYEAEEKLPWQPSILLSFTSSSGHYAQRNVLAFSLTSHLEAI